MNADSRQPQIPKRFLILNTQSFLQASKNRSYREHALTMFRALAQFFDEQRYAVCLLVPLFEADPAKFQVYSCDLTDEGMLWVRSHFGAWSKRMDRRTKVQSFEDYLKSLRDTLE